MKLLHMKTTGIHITSDIIRCLKFPTVCRARTSKQSVLTMSNTVKQRLHVAHCTVNERLPGTAQMNEPMYQSHRPPSLQLIVLVSGSRPVNIGRLPPIALDLTKKRYSFHERKPGKLSDQEAASIALFQKKSSPRLSQSNWAGHS